MVAKARPTTKDVSARYSPVQILNPEGELLGPSPVIKDEQLVRILKLMILGRSFDQRALSLQRQGRIGTYAPISGQEAVQVVSALCLSEDEWMFPTYRDYAAMYVHGMPLRDLFLYPMGHPQGGRAPDGVNIYAISISIATHLPHAVGAAWASKIKGEKKAFITYHGDGATSEGDFHEAMNFAGVFQVPLVTVCENNGWAISLPRERQTHSETIAQKGEAYGVTAIMVDGNDVLALYKVITESLERAREGKGPTFVEAVTYRLGPHTTADDPGRYRSQEELEEMKLKDPLVRTTKYLKGLGLLSDSEEVEMWEEAKTLVSDALKEAESIAPPDPDFFFDHVYAELTPNLVKQRREFVPEEAE